MQFRFKIPGEPVPKARPRVTRQGHAYTPRKTADYEALVKDCYRLQGGKYMGDSAIVSMIELRFEIPKSYGKSKRERIMAGEIKHTKKPDVDNCVKAILDALNGIAYKDDSQIVELTVDKQYTDEGAGAIVTLEEVF